MFMTGLMSMNAGLLVKLIQGLKSFSPSSVVELSLLGTVLKHTSCKDTCMKTASIALLLSFISASASGKVCRELLSTKLNYTLIKPKHANDEGRLLNNNHSLDFYVLDASKNKVGVMGGFLEESKESYYDFYIYLDEGFQKKGLSYVFFTEFFKKFPKTHPFKFLIIDQNLESFFKGLDQGLSMEEASKQVYSVKTLVKFGYIFSSVEYDPNSSEEVYITLSPPGG